MMQIEQNRFIWASIDSKKNQAPAYGFYAVMV
jgi:hypothetical protein